VDTTRELETDSLPLVVYEQIGRLRERFEDECQRGAFPEIRAYLKAVDAGYKELLFEQLLQLAVEYTKAVDLQSQRSMFGAKFPEFAAIVNRVIDRHIASMQQQRLPDDLPRFGPYVATRELGRGGFGIVYLATHDDTGHHVAIKIGSQSLHEAKTLLHLKHPSIIRVLHVARDAKDRTYLVMDYMEGGSLRERIQPEHLLLPEEAIRIASRIVEALHAAHSHAEHIYHRDLKPENILFDADGNVCVADFGLAVAEADLEHHRGDFSGTPPYQSPEQVLGKADWIDARSDIWAVGVVLYEMLTGQRPFKGKELRNQIVHKAPKSPSQLRDGIPEELEQICLKCLSKDPKDRYQTANGLARALRGQELGVNPYKGLESFDEADADRFFGRESQIIRLRERFEEIFDASLGDVDKPRVLSVLGPSGCGKSSIVRAGLVPMLKREGVGKHKSLRVTTIRPRMRPLKSLADALDSIAGGSEEAGVARSRRYIRDLQQLNEKGEFDGLWWIVDSLHENQRIATVFVVDQFEEIFTECEDEQERQQFIENLLYAASRKDGCFSVVLTLRSDFLAETQQHEQLNSAIADHGILVPAMTESELREAIATPARNAGHEFDPATVDLLLKESCHRDGALPLLQVVLSKIWDGLRTGVAPTETYRRLGGLGGALACAAEQIFSELSDEEKAIARRIFLGLVKLGEGTQDTRRTAEVSQILSYMDDPQTAKRVLSKFSSKEARFVSLKHLPRKAGTEAGAITAELTHEALLDHWQRFRGWIDEGRADIRFRERLDDAARRWDELGRLEGSLWRLPELHVLLQRKGRLEHDFNSIQKLFADASEAYEVRLLAESERLRVEEQERAKQETIRQKKELSRLRLAACLFMMLVVGLLGVSGYAYKTAVSEVEARREAEDAALSEARERENAQRASWRFTMNEAQRLCEEGDIAQGLLTFDQALEIAESIGDRRRADVCRLNLVSWSRELHVLDQIFAHGERANDIAISADGSTLAVACSDRMVHLWDISTGDRIAGPLPHPEVVASVCFDPNGKVLVAGCTDGKARIWKKVSDGWQSLNDVEHHAPGKELKPTFRPLPSGISSIAFTPDGSRFATGGFDGVARVWERQSFGTSRLGGRAARSV
jgi:serine/threonine protein kinase